MPVNLIYCEGLTCSATEKIRRYDLFTLCPSCAVDVGFEPKVSCIDCKLECVDPDATKEDYCVDECLCANCKFKRRGCNYAIEGGE